MTGFAETFTANLVNLAGPALTFLTVFPSRIAPLSLLIPLPFLAAVLLGFASGRRLVRYRFRKVFRLLVRPTFFRHRSHRLDLMILVANTVLFVAGLSYLILSIAAVHAFAASALLAAFGPVAPPSLSPYAIAGIWTVTLFLVFEFAYWLDHYLAHRIPMLWEFHKVHHSAEHLSPLTGFRVHPVDTIVYLNILAVLKGLAIAVVTHVFGQRTIGLEVWGLLGVLSIAGGMLSQLHHTQIWLPLRGWLGRLVLSPAHHQIHHSTAREHHDRNFGHILGVFDWLAGTLFMPPQKRPKLMFGVDGMGPPRHDLSEALLQPFMDAAKHLPAPSRPELVAPVGEPLAR